MMRDIQIHIEDDIKRKEENKNMSNDELKKHVEALSERIEDQVREDLKQKYTDSLERAPSVQMRGGIEAYLETVIKRDSFIEIKIKVKELIKNTENQMKKNPKLKFADMLMKQIVEVDLQFGDYDSFLIDFKRKYCDLLDEEIERKVRELKVKGYLTGDREKYLSDKARD